MGNLKSWSCKGCTNVCYRIANGETQEYCRSVIEKGKFHTKWVTDDFVDCLDKTTDPKATDVRVRFQEG